MRRALAVAIVMMSGAGIGVVHGQTPSHARASSGCSVKAVTFKNWKAEEISNSLVRLTLVPQLGGRLMQVTFGDHDYLFVNEQLKGQSFTPAQSLAQHKWFNYGGDKIWPMPEGEDDEQHW